MDSKGFIWNIVKVFAFATIGFLLAFPLTTYTSSIMYPTFASFEILLNKNLTAGSFKNFFDFVVFIITAYFIYSLCYFINNLVVWIVKHVGKSGHH